MGKMAMTAGVPITATMMAGAAFTRQFPRDDYVLPGAATIFAAVRLPFESLFIRPAEEFAASAMTTPSPRRARSCLGIRLGSKR